MITFVSVAAAMVAVAITWLLVPLLRHDRRVAIAREASNLAILLDQLRELNADLANGTLSSEQYEQSRRELEQRALQETTAAPAPAGRAPFAGAWTAAILAGALPMAAMLLYLTLGNHDAFSPAATRIAAPAAERDVSPQNLDEMVSRLAARLEKEPDNAAGWIMLARTYSAMNRLPEAISAYDRAANLAPDNADLLADYADALAFSTGGKLQGKSLELVERALKASPTHWKALALAGTAAFDRKDYQRAIAYWEKTRQTVPRESGIARSLDSSIAEARKLAGLKAEAPSLPLIRDATSTIASKPATRSASSPVAADRTAIAGTVMLSPALAAIAAPDDTVFVFARAAQGPKVPLAILRKQVKDLPAAFSLDDSMAMMPDMKISKFADLIVGARVSKSGSATPQSGDLEGFSQPVQLGAEGINLVIDSARR